jgi:hypothetical protein
LLLALKRVLTGFFIFSRLDEKEKAETSSPPPSFSQTGDFQGFPFSRVRLPVKNWVMTMATFFHSIEGKKS